MTQPPPLDEAQLTRRLVEPGLVSRLVRAETTDSTNAELLREANCADFAAHWPHMSVLTAEEQSAGRGRLGRSWASPKSSTLSTSILLRPSLPRTQWHWLTLTAGLALVRTLRAQDVPAALKWPNDVHVSGRKIAGLLALVSSDDPAAVIIGCGVNVLQTPDQLPTSTSTSVVLERQRAGHPMPEPGAAEASRLRTEVLADWVEAFAQLMHQLQAAADVAPLRADIVAALSTPGEEVRVELPGGTAVRGRALGVDEHGALQVEVTARRRTVLDPEALDPEPGGGREDLWEQTPAARESYTAGDVVHLRPTHD